MAPSSSGESHRMNLLGVVDPLYTPRRKRPMIQISAIGSIVIPGKISTLFFRDWRNIPGQTLSLSTRGIIHLFLVQWLKW